jgi:hypothetical protein
MTTRRLIAFAHGHDDPACRFRIRQYIPCFNEAGWKVSLRTNHPERPWQTPLEHPLLRKAHQYGRLAARQVRRRWDIHQAAHYDAVLLNRDVLGGNVAYERQLIGRNPRVIFDFDDAVFLDGKAGHVEWICRHAAWVTAGNDVLASFARQFSDRVTMLPTVVDTDTYAGASPGSGARRRVGWIGSDRSIRETLAPHLPMLAEIQRALGFELVVISKPRPQIDLPGMHWTFIEWSPDVETRMAGLFDVGIMPLVDTPFQQGKCGCKALQYMAAGLPVVASPVGVNTALVGRNERGALATSPEEWRAALASFLHDADLRARIGARGRAFVDERFSLRRWGPVLVEIVERVAASGGVTA